MPLTPAERHRLRGLWLALVRSSVVPDPEALATMREARKWPSPLDRREQAFVLFALASLAHAFVSASQTERLRMADALSHTALLAQHYLGAEGPPQNMLPFRRDVDG